MTMEFYFKFTNKPTLEMGLFSAKFTKIGLRNKRLAWIVS